MQIPIGEQVVILESGITGIIDHYDGSTAFVLVDGELYQAHKNDIARVSDFGAKAQKEQREKQRVDPQPADAGLFIQWQAVKSLSGELQHFEVSLINHTTVPLLFEYKFYLLESLHTTVRNTVSKGEPMRLHICKPDQINDRPVADLQCWKKNDSGITILVAEAEIKLRPKQYVARLHSEPYTTHGFFRFDVPLSDATLLIQPKRVSEEKKAFTFEDKKKVAAPNEVLQKASMPDFIDLHADKLIPNHRQLDANDILTMQINAFKHFLEKSIRLRLHRIYAVHGLGKGVLRQEIEKALKKYPEVTSYNNDYTARFGFGATEIILD